MGGQWVDVLRHQIRGVTGALLALGVTFHYTMETWWLGWTLPYWHLLTYSSVGLVLITILTRHVGFKKKNESENRLNPSDIALDFGSIVVQSLIATYVTLLLIGIIEIGDPLSLVVRLGLIEMVPLGFGAALANKLFRGAEEESDREAVFPQNLAVFAIGAVFITGSIAPTQEMELISAHMTWFRHLLLGVFSLVVVYLVLYELEFQGQSGRSDTAMFEVGTTFIAYGIGLVVSLFLLAAFGHFRGATVSLIVQETLVLGYPASLGAAAAKVVI